MSRVTQEHHIFTKKEREEFLKDLTGRVYKGEHLILSRLQWYSKGSVSRAFIWALKIFIAINEPRAIDLEGD